MKDFRAAFLEKYPNNAYVLNRMVEYDGEPEWEKFTRPWLSGMTRYFKEVMSDSSARVALSYIKAVLNEYSELVKLPTNKFAEALSVRDTRAVETWLTEDELSMLKCTNESERPILYDFLLGAFTGARQSDYLKFDDKNIVKGRVDYNAVKTGTRVLVPIKPIVKRIINHPRANVSNQYFNTVIKVICRNSGINEEIKLFRAGKEVVGEKWRFISSHTARRSFATNLYLRGVDIVSIGRMMGHSSIEMTKRYIVSGMRDLSEDEMEFFK